jgi:hypothetical protein
MERMVPESWGKLMSWLESFIISVLFCRVPVILTVAIGQRRESASAADGSAVSYSLSEQDD